jgi:hypothetical protein
MTNIRLDGEAILPHRPDQRLDAVQRAVADAEFLEMAHCVGEIIAAGAAVAA